MLRNQVLHTYCQQTRTPTHHVISMVESTDEINMDITSDQESYINPPLIYMDFIYNNCIINIIIQRGKSTNLQSPTDAAITDLMKRDSATNATSVKPS